VFSYVLADDADCHTAAELAIRGPTPVAAWGGAPWPGARRGAPPRGRYDRADAGGARSVAPEAVEWDPPKPSRRPPACRVSGGSGAVPTPPRHTP
jgi:hypothetical protein